MKIPVYLLFILLSCSGFNAFSQANVGGTVRGKIIDTAGKQNLSEASVSVMRSPDAEVEAFAITDKTGSFLVKNLAAGSYKLIISFQGYQSVTRRFSVSADKKDIDLGDLYMQRASDTLPEVIVEVPPIQMKKDTVEYNAGIFSTKPNALAEDLLKKLPGIQVDKNGSITAHGETVTRVLVNGKRFFSDDPKLATRNLPPDIIDKIQVFDDLSDQSKFTGFDDGNRVKTINIVTKKDKRQGYFGKGVAGAGTNENYDESINLHRFDNDRQISLLGQANDINKQNFTPQDILGTSGSRRGGGNSRGGGGSGQSSSGITTVWAGGLNYRDAWGPKTDAYGSYFFNSQHVSVRQQDSTINSVKTPEGLDSFYTVTSNQSSIQKTQNHRINFNIEQRFDSNNSLVFRPNITFQTTTPYASSSSITVDNHGKEVLSSSSKTSSYNSGFNINNANLQLRHKFAKKFRTISLDLNLTANKNDGYGTNNIVNGYYIIDGNYSPLPRLDSINQYYNDSLHSITLSPTLSYTEPIGKNQILEFNYNHTYNRYRSINNTYSYNEDEKQFNIFDSLYSNSYRFISNSDRFTLNYRIQQAKFNLSFGSGIQLTSFNSLNTTKNITVDRNYTNLTPTVNLQYSFSSTKRLRLNYTGRTGTPSASQLQPLTTTSDSINFQVGNPALKPQFTHSLRMLYTSFNPSTQRVLFATINASTIVNDIQNAVIIQTNKRTSTYVNLNGTYNVSGYFNYGFPLKKPKSNLNFITNLNYSQSQTLQATAASSAPVSDYTHIYTRNTGIGETISWTTNIKKNFDMNFSSTSTYNIGRNSFNSKQNLNSFSQTFSAEITAYTNSGWLIATTFDYTYTNTGSAGYNASVPLLNPSIAKQLFKKKQGELRLSVFDLLDQNTSVNKTVSLYSTAYTRTNVLSRYVMLTFTYNLNNFAGSQQRRMPGMFPRGIRGGGMGRPPGE